ncbi:MAG: prepilin-type N-terminal cleavage/methylation domain-containing protein [Cyanobacteria bacterium]|nr:prepilin-type N-terminal cleavage/methylation domain-containing protein [Cyanobacteriota bacterium]
MKSGLSRRDKHLRMVLRMLPKRTDRRGFTLIELLVAILISGLIVSGLLYLVVEVLGINQKDAARSDTQRDMQMAMDYITRDLREAFYVYGTEVEGTSVESCLADRDDAATRGAGGLCTGLLASLPAHLKYLPDKNNIPVLAFWKPEPLPDGVSAYCKTNVDKIGVVVRDASGVPQENPVDRVPCVSQRMYTLVVYSLNTDNSSKIWKGRARIKRYALPHFAESTTNTKKSGWVAPVASDDKRPLSWPFGKSDNGTVDLQLNASSANTSITTIPAAGKPLENSAESVVLTDFVDYALDAAAKPVPAFAISPIPTETVNSGYCPYGFEVANFKAFRPEFYACVRRASVNENPEVRVVIKGNAAGRGAIPYATGDVPFQMEAQVTGRGVYSKQRSGS